MSKETVYIAWDIEKGGPCFEHPIIAVGVCYGTKTTYRKKRFCLTFDINNFEEKCLKEFWSKFPNILEKIKSEATPVVETWEAITDFLTLLEVAYPEDKYNIVMLSDNPAYDIGHIDYNLFHYTARWGLRYTDNGDYRFISNPCEQLVYHPNKENIKRAVRALSKHTHMPDDDAECIFMTQILLKNPEMVSGRMNLPKLE